MSTPCTCSLETVLLLMHDSVKRKGSVRTTHPARGLLFKKENDTGFVICGCFDTIAPEWEHSSICNLFRSRTYFEHPPENTIAGLVSKSKYDSL